MDHVPEDILACVLPYAAAGSLLTAIRISHVSREWRAVALSLSQLWSHFEYILGIEVARFQMSRISATVAISVDITIWDLGLHSRSALASDTWYQRIKRWLEDTQILGHPRWKALHIMLSSDLEGAYRLFDLISPRKDPLSDLHICLPPYNYDHSVVDETIKRLQFRPKRVHLEGLLFPLSLLNTHFQELSSLKYAGGFQQREVMVVPADASIAVMSRLSTVELHNLNSKDFFTHARAPSLSYLHLSNAFDDDPLQTLLSASTFAPSLRRLRIYASTDTLCEALSTDLHFPDLASLEIELYDVERNEAFMTSLRSLDFGISFPKLQIFTLTRAYISPDRLGDIIGLPQTALVIKLVDCTNARLIREVPAQIDLQIMFGDDVQEEAGCPDNDEEYVCPNESISGAEEHMTGGSSEESGWGVEEGSPRSPGSFASHRSEFRVSLWTNERRMLEMWDVNSTDDEDERMMEMDGDGQSDVASQEEGMELS